MIKIRFPELYLVKSSALQRSALDYSAVELGCDPHIGGHTVAAVRHAVLRGLCSCSRIVIAV